MPRDIAPLYLAYGPLILAQGTLMEGLPEHLSRGDVLLLTSPGGATVHGNFIEFVPDEREALLGKVVALMGRPGQVLPVRWSLDEDKPLLFVRDA